MKRITLLILITVLNYGMAMEDELRMVSKMYDSGKARSIGDLVTITISESSSSSKAETLSTEKTATKAANSGALPENIEKENKAIKLLNDFASLRGLNISATSSFAGTGSSSTSETLSAQITARVVDIMKNGNLVIKGERRVKMKQEEVHIVMTGIIRVRDISRANLINSNKISDAHIYYETSGDVTDGTQPGLLWRIFLFINPF